MGLKEMALQEVERVEADRREREEEEAAKQRQAQINTALHNLEKLGIDTAAALTDDQTGIVTIDGIRFRERFILGVCPRCNEEVTSDRVDSLYDIGRAIQSFQPWYHTCLQSATTTDEQPPETSADRLIAALEAFIRERYSWE